MKKKFLAITMVLALSVCACSKKTTEESAKENDVTKEPEITATTEPTKEPENIETQGEETKEDNGTDFGNSLKKDTTGAREKVNDMMSQLNEGKKDDEPENKPVSNTNITKLSDDIYSYQISINDKIYQFPMKYSDFIAAGWKYDSADDEMVSSGSYMVSDWFKKDKDEVITFIMNLGINEAPIKDCYIGGIKIDNYGLADTTKILLPKGIEFGVSTVKEVEAAYGTPSDRYDSDSYPTVTYKMDSYNYVTLTFDAANKGILQGIDIENFEKPEDFNEGEVSTEIPAITLAYKAPKRLDKDLLTYSVEFAGDLYQLPAPVSEFIKNGWTEVADDTEPVITGNSYGKVTLRRDNQEFYAYVDNYDSNATACENCFVTRLDADAYQCNVSMTVANEIKTGMKQAALEKALKGYDVEKEENDSYTLYDVKDSKSLTYGYEIIVRDGSVGSIEVTYDPSGKEYRESMGIK